MARKLKFYMGETPKCHQVELQIGEYIDQWCSFHGQYFFPCVECGRKFHSDRPHTKYCSDACSQRAYRNRKKVS